LVSKYKFTGAAVERDAAKGFWGRHHLTSFNSVPFCAGDASVTRFGPDTFDLVLSNSAFESWAPKESVCQAAKDALTMLRPGGCAWIGNLGGVGASPLYSNEAYWSNDCFSALPVVVATVNERRLFGVSEGGSEAYSLFFCRREPLPSAVSTVKVPGGCRVPKKPLAFAPSALAGGGRNTKRRSKLTPALQERVLGVSGLPATSSDHLQCPKPTEVDEAIQKDARSSCSKPQGTLESAAATRCKFEAAARAMDLQRGAAVFNWGAGCGHELAWLRANYEIAGFGCGHAHDDAQWARRHGIAKICTGGCMDLSYIPEGSFHHVVSNAAMHHLLAQAQCDVVTKDIARILTTPGSAWLGANPVSKAGLQLREEDWEKCLVKLSSTAAAARALKGGKGPRYAHKIVHELDFFGVTEQRDGQHEGEKALSIFIWKY